MELGAFSISLAVKDLEASRKFYVRSLASRFLAEILHSIG
jgi:hypothetical protein